MNLEQRKEMMVKYLLMKVEEQDWHGVADAAMDLRDIENYKAGLEAKLSMIVPEGKPLK